LSIVAGVVLAAGKGTRMKSDLPKVLHLVCGVPMAELAGRAMREAGVSKPVLVVGHGSDAVRDALGDSYAYAEQPEQLGTGHALACGLSAIPTTATHVVVAPGDAPLITGEAISKLISAACESGAECALAVCTMANPYGYGRVVRNASGDAVRIVEEPDATDAERAIQEVCTSFYCFRTDALAAHLGSLGTRNAKGEQYLTDMIQAIAEAGGRTVTVSYEDADSLGGVNDRWQLAQAAEKLRSRVLRRLAESGVDIVDPSTTFVDADTVVGERCRILPMTILEGKTEIGNGCEIGPHTRITSARVGDETLIHMSHVNRATIGRDCRIGPFANIRPQTVLADGVRIGNFVEVKNSQIGEDASLSHLTYCGDATVGARANIGAGTITCNFDGFEKHRTDIGSDAFIGSNSTLVAPVKIGDGAMTAAGSTISEDVPANDLAIGRSRQENKEGWAERWRRRKKS
jgi:bifunctional UDP-N-acetylglucosamine pyrophosphorylase/glucosamine-1-phosphate N-acetyltransferase